MNDRIKQLTGNYLNTLPYYELNDEQKREIIRLNGQTNWIIFSARSLEASNNREIYNINSPELQELLTEQVKIYHSENWRTTFMPGEELAALKITCFAFVRDDSWIGHNYWMAINKTGMGDGFGGVTMDIENCDLTLGESLKKVDWRLDNLLNDPTILNSTAPAASNDDTEEQNQGDGSQNNQTPNPPPPNPPPHTQTTATRDLTFTIDSMLHGYDGNPNFITLSHPMVVENTNISFIMIQSNDPLLQAGNQVITRDVVFGPGQAEIWTDSQEIVIRSHFRTIELVSTNSFSPPPPPPPPPSFPDVLKKNQDLIDEEIGFIKLRDELKDIIDKNKSVVQEAQTLGLTLPSFSDNALDFFQTAPFFLFDIDQPPNSPYNQQTSDKNDKTRQKVLNLKNNIYQIYNSNVKKLNEKKQGDSPPIEDELTKFKKRAIDRINTILTDPDNLRNIDLNTLAGGKYRNWENDIMGLNEVDEVNDYLNAFSTALKEKGAKEKETEEQEKNNDSSERDSQENDNIIDDETKNFVRNLPLPAAKSVVRSKILELFRKHQPDLEKLKEIWVGSDSWMDYLDNLTSSVEVVVFLEKMEQAMVQQSQNRKTKLRFAPSPRNSNIIPFLVIGLIILLGGLIFVALLRRRRKKIN